eukprot:TRINITY_DN25041_c0_g1_i1.p1 TRINITY_DN25041_c0_g1~~TRINITY_DN25041_c0_g1_i1.p1  ORF type:complete len:160 (-),score=24.35 TRINITY_DN25041_c0_g1_i1:123-602(-)
MSKVLLSVFILLGLAATTIAIQCYACDGIKQSDGPCAGDGQIGEKVTCEDKCGLLLEERMTEKKGSVVSSESRWRRGCATDGQELIDNSEAKADKVTGKLGCTNVGQSSYDNIIVRHTLCLCNTTLCNTHKNAMGGVAASRPGMLLVGLTSIVLLVQVF